MKSEYFSKWIRFKDSPFINFGKNFSTLCKNNAKLHKRKFFYKIVLHLKIIQWHFHGVEKNRDPAGSLPPYVRVYSRRTTVPSIKAALREKYRLEIPLLSSGSTLSGRIHFRYQSRGLRVAQARTKHTSNTPLSPLPPRNANSAIEFSGILPDAVELNFAATLCRYTRALPSPPIPFYSDCRASLIPLSTSLDIFHGIGKGGQEKRRATSLLLIRRRFPRSGFKGGEFESWERETLWLKEKGNEGVTRPRVGALRKSSAFKRGCFLPAGNFSKRKMCLTNRHRPNEQMIEDDFCLDRYRHLDKMMWKKIEKMWMRWNGIYIYEEFDRIN